MNTIIPDSDSDNEILSPDIFANLTDENVSSQNTSTNAHSTLQDVSRPGTSTKLKLINENVSRPNTSKSTNLINHNNTGTRNNTLSDDDDPDIPQDVLDEADAAMGFTIPAKSRLVYEKAYRKFKEYQKIKKIKVTNETVLLGYLHTLAREKKPKTLWATYSMLKKTLYRYERIDISRYLNVTSFLSGFDRNSGHKVKKANVFSDAEMNKFLCDAPDNQWLAAKAALIFGIYGLCRRSELHDLTMDRVAVHDEFVKVYLTDTKTEDRSFVVTGDHCSILKKYLALRPANVPYPNFFIRYANGRCTQQVIGIHTLGDFPKRIAKYLKLADAEKYTSHAFRRSGATNAVNSGVSRRKLMDLGGWNSSKSSDGYFQNSTVEQLKVAEQIGQNVTKSTPSCTATTSTPSHEGFSVSTKQTRVQTTVHQLTSSGRSEGTLRNVQQLINIAPQQQPNIHLNFYNCSGMNFFGDHNKENR